MIPRHAQRLIRDRLKDYPAVALIGPRQCGKTTLAQALGGVYFDLEQQGERLRLDLEWDNLAAGKRLAILDEAQSWPEVFSRLRGAIDQDRKRMGRFLLLGSVSPSLMVHVSESLAGRLSLIELAPFQLGEVASSTSLEARWLFGGYPDGGVLNPKRYPQWQLDYLSLLTKRDLPAWGLPAHPSTTDRLLRMLAALHGQTWNASQVGKSLGLSYHTVNHYLDYLCGAFLIRRLQPFQANLGKRLIKSPKVYWRDSGLLHALHNVSDRNSLLSQPWVGASWEGFVIQEAISALTALGKRFNAYYFKTSDQKEIDLLLDFGDQLWAVEIKLTSAPGPEDLKRLDYAADLIGASHRLLVSQSARSTGTPKHGSFNLPSFLELLKT